MIISPFYDQSLHQKIEGQKLNEDEVRQIAYGLCQGLSYLHSLNIAHRDIKPTNIMLEKAGSPVIIDFGSSGEVDIKHGTEGYYAPEQTELPVLGIGMDLRKLDSWSLGQTLAECIDPSSKSYFKDIQIKKKIFNKKKVFYSINNCSPSG